MIKENSEIEMSEIKKCPGCNLRKRNLYTWYDSISNINLELCEDCIFLREFEIELTSDLEDKDNQRVLIDYEAFNYQKKTAFPYRWLENYILKAYLDKKKVIILDDLLDEWTYKEVDLEEDIIPKFVEWNLLTTPENKEIDGSEKKIMKLGGFIDNLMKNHLKNTLETGRFESIGKILRLIDGRIGFGIEARTTFKDTVRRKLMKLALKYGYDRDNGKIKEISKVIETTSYRCNLCNELTDFRYKLYEHFESAHQEIKKEEYDNYVIPIEELKGLKIPREKVAELDEMKTYGSSWRSKLVELFKRDAFFVDSEISHNESVMVISAPWANVLEKVNEKVKNRIKVKEKVKTTN